MYWVTAAVPPVLPCDLPMQDQYVFIHDAVLESLTCGDTQIPASGLSSAIKKLKEKDRVTGRTGFETQFHVSSFKCLEILENKDNLVIL